MPTITLKDLLAKNAVEKIDFLSISVAGSEPGVLAGFDIENHMPSLVRIEAAANHELIASYFAAHGYARIHEPRDRLSWYFKPDYAPVAVKKRE